MPENGPNGRLIIYFFIAEVNLIFMLRAMFFRIMPVIHLSTFLSQKLVNNSKRETIKTRHYWAMIALPKK